MRIIHIIIKVVDPMKSTRVMLYFVIIWMFMSKYLCSILNFISYQKERYLAEECRALIFRTSRKNYQLLKTFKSNNFHWYLAYLADTFGVLYIELDILKGKHRY